ncbi:MAG: hypothetical protein FGM24_01800 [Candidatus Kapabacteria bacterium]|nr:hypothetical protein [Candidatus Kapabacteria bacterium]
MNTRIATLVLFVTMLIGCGTTSVDTTGTIVVEGTVQQLAGTTDCYLIEVGKKVSEKAFYQLLDTPERLSTIAGKSVKLRIRVDSAAKGPCPVGTPAHVITYM